MDIIATPKKILALPEELVGYHVATVQDQPSRKLYAFVEKWQAPWNAPNAVMAGWGVYDMTEAGDIDFSDLSEQTFEVTSVVEQAGLKRSFPTFQTRM
jgi:hypothetical protein